MYFFVSAEHKESIGVFAHSTVNGFRHKNAVCAGPIFVAVSERDPNRACKVRPFLISAARNIPSVQSKTRPQQSNKNSRLHLSGLTLIAELTLNVQMMRLSGVQQSIKVGARGGRFIFNTARAASGPREENQLTTLN